MARARNIKPAFFLNTDLSEIEPLGRLAFIGLWTIADYKGCLIGNFKKIKAQILPYDDCNIESLMNNLEQFRFIRYYYVQGIKYIKILNFERHQNPHKNERDSGSDIPDIDENDNSFNELTKDGTNTDFIGSTHADSLLLIPSSLIPDTSSAQKIEKVNEEFELFWLNYPKKKSKGTALKAWKLKKPRIDNVLYALSWQRESVDWTKDGGKFIPYPATYLNAEGWNDEEPQNNGVPF